MVEVLYWSILVRNNSISSLSLAYATESCHHGNSNTTILPPRRVPTITEKKTKITTADTNL